MTSGRIAVVIREMEGPFQMQLVRAMRDVARRNNLEVIFFPGRGLGSASEFERQFAITYGLAENAPVQGMIVVGGTLGRDADPHLVRRMLERQVAQRPMVAIGSDFGVGSPVVVGDNRGGMQALLAHLIDHHACRRFAYLHGARGSVDSVERYGAVREILADYGLPLRSELEAWGEFNTADTMLAMPGLMPHIGEIDVLVCANDAMAHAAIQFLAESGIRVPQDVRVVGYDDAHGTGDLALPITSISQDIPAQVEHAVAILMALMAGETVGKHEVVPAQLAVRTTCGCGYHLYLEAGHVSAPDWLLIAEHELSDKLDASAASDRDFLDQFERLADIAVRHGLNRRDLVESLLRVADKAGEGLPERAAAIRRRLVLAAALLCGLEQRGLKEAQPPFRLNSETFAGRLREGMRGQRRDDVQQALLQTLSMVGVKTAFVVTYGGVGHVDAQGNTSLPLDARLLFAMLDGKLLEVDHQEFATALLLPWHDIPRGVLPLCVVQPLFNHNDHYGYCVFALDDDWRVSLEELRDGISSVVCGRLVIAEIERARDRLRNDLEQALHAQDALNTQVQQDDMTGLANRRGLMRALQTLAASEPTPPWLLLTDLDGLKDINDRFGHAEGDRAILAFGQSLRQSMPASAICARLGGDEFAVLLPRCTAAAMATLHDALLREVAATNAALQGAWELGFSHGHSALAGFGVDALVEALRSADELLYQEKAEHKRQRNRGPDRRTESHSGEV
ncbi:GGDEF domain-containing protein [Niveibacterium sp. SC-1]|uniref:GGDEF domain-containing protein n=1 Tax=Niveibacterium sp. SC-1 TaxID=3135646 RepID=UPI00311F4116